MQLKFLERAVRSAARRMIGTGLRQVARGERPDWRAREHRVLFLRHDRIGDMILSTGILRTIAASAPTIRLDVLASPINAPVLRAESYVHEVIVFDRHRPLMYPAAGAGLRRRRYDAVIDCMITAPSLTTLLLMLGSGARHRIGVSQGNEKAYTLPLPPRESAVHIVDKLGALLTAFGVEPSGADLRPRITLTAAERDAGELAWRGGTGHAGIRRPRLLVNVSAGRAFRHWPDERFARVAQLARLRRGDVDVLVIGSPSDSDRVASIAAMAGVPSDTPSLRAAFGIVAASDVVFTPDTSIAHVASAFEKPATVMYIRDMARLWGPYHSVGRTLESPTQDLDPISAEDAASQLGLLLEAVTAGRAAE